MSSAGWDGNSCEARAEGYSRPLIKFDCLQALNLEYHLLRGLSPPPSIYWPLYFSIWTPPRPQLVTSPAYTLEPLHMAPLMTLSGGSHSCSQPHMPCTSPLTSHLRKSLHAPPCLAQLNLCTHLSLPDPRSARWIPQLQLHMFASGCLSALLVSRSASKGTRVYRLYRDEAYLALMLRLSDKVYCSFVLPRHPPRAAAGTTGSGEGWGSTRDPPANMYFKNDSEYRQFLVHTARLARSARLISEVPHH